VPRSILLDETDELGQLARKSTDAACGLFGNALLIASGVPCEEAKRIVSERMGRAIKSNFVVVKDFMLAVSPKVKTINLFYL